MFLKLNGGLQHNYIDLIWLKILKVKNSRTVTVRNILHSCDVLEFQLYLLPVFSLLTSLVNPSVLSLLEMSVRLRMEMGLWRAQMIFSYQVMTNWLLRDGYLEKRYPEHGWGAGRHMYKTYQPCHPWLRGGLAGTWRLWWTFLVQNCGVVGKVLYIRTSGARYWSILCDQGKS